MYISTVEELEGFCGRCRQSRVLAVDTEFLRERTYHPKLCLIQVATPDECAVVDTLAISDLGPLRDLFCDTALTKVFHACGQDLEVIYDTMGCIPKPIFDTQLGAAFLGYRMQIGLGALVQAMEGVHLAKDAGLTDWSRRPLDADQIRYAEEDVLYLPKMYERMMAELVEKDRVSWIVPELEELCDMSRLVRDPSLAYVHLKRASTLSRRQLAVARELCLWREKSAQRRDLPRRWVLSDEVIVELCRYTPHSAERLRRTRGTEQLSSRDVNQIIAAIRKGEKCPPENYPRLQHRSHSNAGSDGVIDLMYALVRIQSERSGVAIPLIATRDDLHAFFGRVPGARLAKGWRYDLVGGLLEGLLAGEVGLTVKDGNVELL